MTAVADPPLTRSWVIPKDFVARCGVEVDEVVQAGEVVGLVFTGLPVQQSPKPPFVLAPRLLEVLHGMADGLSNREIGARLGLSEETAKTHAHRLFVQTGASDRAHAVAIGFRYGWLR